MVPYQPVLTFWFEECTPKQWFQKDSAFDKEIKDMSEHPLVRYAP